MMARRFSPLILTSGRSLQLHARSRHRPDTVSISQTSMQAVSKGQFGVAVNPNYVSDAKRGGNRPRKICGR